SMYIDSDARRASVVKAGGDSYVSDPAKPVPHLSRPVNFDDGRWKAWLVSDQRQAGASPP
ncbi:MAG: hypothetical protein DI592_16405, partial [Stenotrophomonas maltophilia]